MEFLNSKRFILILVVILISVGLFGCTYKIKDISAKPDPVVKEEPTTLDTIGKMDAIVDVIGCMFAPKSCKE
jgi:hypothetical protein|tara:strand:- start:737 stop:952 length:216 start_codon:yes stop_codon:yes gene_type:complete